MVTNTAVAVGWVLAGTVLFTLVYASAKFSGGAISSFQIVWLRYLGGFATVVMLARSGGSLRRFQSRQPANHLFRAVLGCSAGVAVIQSSAMMPIMDATAIGLLNVVIVVVLGALVLKEHVSLGHWAAVAVSTLGAGLVVQARGAFQGGSTMWPSAIALAGAILLALEALLIRRLSQSEAPLTVLLYVNFFGVWLMAIPAILSWSSMSLGQFVSCCALGPLAISAQYCVIRGYRLAPVSVLGPVDYTWLVFAALLGVVAFSEVPGPGVLLGAGLIIVGGVLLIRASGDQ
jgi:drug/metabolite transporter (DMT)-like permease